MKICTWNVNGLRAILGKGFAQSINNLNPDVLCLQEIKARPEQIDPDSREITGYQSWWNPAERPGYSGVATFSKVKPLDVVFGLGDPQFDVEGRVIRLQFKDFYLYNIYFPNGQRGKERVDYKLAFYDLLLQQCKDLIKSGNQVIITGDFNTSHTEIDLANPKENETTSGFLPEERVWIDVYLQNGFIDIYRKLNPDAREYTWWTYRFKARERNIGWRLDYYLISSGLEQKAKEVRIFGDILGSDHCPVMLELAD